MQPTTVTTPLVRLSYANVFKPRENALSKKQEYSAALLFKKGEDLSALKRAMTAALEKKFGKNKSEWPQQLRNPFRDQKDRGRMVDGKLVLPDGYEEGAVYINVRSDQKPGVVDKNLQPILDETEVYSGCWCHVSVNAYAYDAMGNKGAAFGLMNIQKVKDDAPLGSRTTPEMDFKPIASDESDESNGAAMDFLS